MPDRSQAVLRVEPNQIPALRAAFIEAVETITDQINALRRDGLFPEPWMGDPVSANVKKAYDVHVMSDATDSTFSHLSMYRDELRKVAETLTSMETEYQRTEGENTALWGSRA